MSLSFKLRMGRRFVPVFTRLIFLVALFLAAFVHADAQWLKGISGSGSQLGKGIAVDASGNVFATGTFSGTTDFDPGPGTFLLSSSCPCDGSNPPKADVYLAKYDHNGGFLWAFRIGGSDADVSGGVSVDAAGNVLVTGTFWGSADFDPGPSAYTLTSLGSSDIFLAKYTTDGTLLWAKNFGGILNDTGDDLAVDALGNCFVTGSFLGSADLDPGTGVTTFNSGSTTDAFFAKFNPAGELLWARDIEGSGEENGHSITTNANGDVYITGTFFGTSDLDAGAGVTNVTGAGSKDTYLAKYNGSGQFVWGKSFGSTGDEQAVDIAADAVGNLYAVGYFVGTVDFDPDAGTTILTSASGLFNGFLMKLASDGTFQWAFSIGAGGDDAALSVAVDAAGNPSVTGYFQGTVDFDPGAGTYALTGLGNEMFLATYTASGSFLWAQKEGAGGDEAAYGLAVDIQGFLYATGYFSGTTNFETGLNTVTLSSAGGNDAFLLKFSAPANIVLPVKFLSFSGLRRGTDALLNWSTSEDPDNREFSVERSTDQNSVWQQVGVVSVNNTTYEFEDHNIPQANVFYRLKQIDRDGRYTYSSVVALGKPSENGVVLYQNIPNPATGLTRINYDLDHASTVKLIAYDATGQKLFETAGEKKNKGSYHIDIDCRNWKTGIYYYQLCSDETSIVKTLVISR
jgi:hypothetical protein